MDTATVTWDVATTVITMAGAGAVIAAGAKRNPTQHPGPPSIGGSVKSAHSPSGLTNPDRRNRDRPYRAGASRALATAWAAEVRPLERAAVQAQRSRCLSRCAGPVSMVHAPVHVRK